MNRTRTKKIIFCIIPILRTLANKYLSVQDANWTIIEPNPSEFKNKGIKVIKGFFEDSKVSINKEDILVFSHVLEHAYDPRIFLKMIYDKIVEGQNLYFSYPRLEIWLEKNIPMP